MFERFSSVYVSGDLGQGLALRQGTAVLFDGAKVVEATDVDINLFFDIAMDFEKIPETVIDNLDTDGLSTLVAQATAKADAMRFLLFGMDRSLSDGLRLASIAQASPLLDGADALAHIRAHFLRIAEPDPWDTRSAAIFAAMLDARLPALLYIAADDPGELERLRASDPAEWPEAAPRIQLARRLGRADGAAAPPLWELAIEWLSGPLSGESATLAAIDAFTRRFAEIEIPGVRAEVARAMIAAAAIRYNRSQRGEPAIAGFDHAIAHLERGDERLRPIVAMALVCKASVLVRLRRHADALDTATEAVALVAGLDDALSREWLAAGQFAQARNLAALERVPEAIEQYERLVATFGRDRVPRVRILVAKARYNRASALLALGFTAQARAALLEFVETLEIGQSPVLRLLHAKALYNLACVTALLGELASACRIYQDAVAACSDIAGAEAEAVQEDSLYNLGTMFARSGDHRQAILAFARAIDLVGEPGDPDRQLLAAQALFNLGLSLEATQQWPQAASAYHLIEARFVMVAEARGVVAKAHARRLSLGDQSGHDADEVRDQTPDDAFDASAISQVFGDSDDG